MQEKDFCLSSGLVRNSLNEEVDRHIGREGKIECFCVGMSVRM